MNATREELQSVVEQIDLIVMTAQEQLEQFRELKRLVEQVFDAPDDGAKDDAKDENEK